MSLTGLASKCGTTTTTVESLIKGVVGVGIASQLNVTTSSLQAFVNGGTSVGLASEMGITSSTLQELRNKIGREGAIGLIIGLAVDRDD